MAALPDTIVRSGRLIPVSSPDDSLALHPDLLEPMYYSAYLACRAAFDLWARSPVRSPMDLALRSRGTVTIPNRLRVGVTRLDDLAQPSFTLTTLFRHLGEADLLVVCAHYYAPVDAAGDAVKGQLAGEVAAMVRDFAWRTGRDKRVWERQPRFVADQVRCYLEHSRPAWTEDQWAGEYGVDDRTIRRWRAAIRGWYKSLFQSAMREAKRVLDTEGVTTPRETLA